MPTPAYRGLSGDQREVLKALDEPITFKDFAKKMEEIDKDKFPHSRTLGIMQTLQSRGLADKKVKLWSRTEAGDRVAKL